MVAISSRGRNTRAESLTAYEYREDPSWSETHAATVGFIFDEELSASGLLNRDGWNNRRELFKEKIERGEVDRARYTTPDGEFLYDLAASESDDPELKTDMQLRDERNAVLAKRRAYSEDVKERGSGSAQFLGMLNGYMLDPINIMTMPIPVGMGAKSLLKATSAMQAAKIAALEVGGKTALVGAASEAVIQPFVYAHKADIESPYNLSDSALAIGSAALGGGILGGSIGAGGAFTRYLKANSKAAREVDDGSITNDIDQIDRSADFVENLRSNRYTKDDTLEIHRARQEGNLDTAATVKGLEEKLDQDWNSVKTGEWDSLNHPTAKLEELQAKWHEENGLSKLESRKFKSEDEKIQAYEEYIEKSLLIDNLVKKRAEIDDLKKAIDEDNLDGYLESVAKQDVKEDIDSIMSVDKTHRESSKPLPKIRPTEKEIPLSPSASKSDMQSTVLDESGLTKQFNNTMEQYSKLKNKKIFSDQNKFIDADDAMAEQDKIIEGMDSVLACTLGE
jgi:hypothetical protein